MSNLKSRQFSTTKLRERYVIGDYRYLKKAFLSAPYHHKISAVEYLSNICNQDNLNFLISEFKTIDEIKLKSYTYYTILIIAQNDKLKISCSDEILLSRNIELMDNIGFIKKYNNRKLTSEPITFRNRHKDHIKEKKD